MQPQVLLLLAPQLDPDLPVTLHLILILVLVLVVVLVLVLALDLDLDVERQGGNVINIRFKDKSVIVVNTQPPLHEIWVAAKSGGYHYRWAGTMAKPLWLDTKTGKELLSDLSEFATAQAGAEIKIALN